MSRMVGGTFGVAAVGALFQHTSDNRLESKLGDLPLSSQQQAWFADNLGSGDVPGKLRQLDPTTAQEVGDALGDAFIHSLSVALKLSTAVAVVGILIALVTLRDARAERRGTVPAAMAPVPRRPD
jgi:hypothetical protein